MSEALKGSADGYFSKEMHPAHAALAIIYKIIQNLHQLRHEPEMTLELDDYKKIFVSAAANLDQQEIRQILTQEVLEEIKHMLDEMRDLKAYDGQDTSYGDLISETKKKQKAIQGLNI